MKTTHQGVESVYGLKEFKYCRGNAIGRTGEEGRQAGRAMDSGTSARYVT